jgi:hypothetical protein
VAATFERANTYVFAGRLIRNAEVRGSIPLCSTNCFQQLTAAGTGGCFGQLANTWTFFLEFSLTASTATRLLVSTERT